MARSPSSQPAGLLADSLPALAAAVVDLCNLARTCRRFAVHVRHVLLHDPSEVFNLHESVTGRYNLLRMALGCEVDLGTFTHRLARLHDAAVQVERAYGGDDNKMLWAFTALLLHACKPLVDVDIWPDPLFEWPTALENYTGLRALKISPVAMGLPLGHIWDRPLGVPLVPPPPSSAPPAAPHADRVRLRRASSRPNGRRPRPAQALQLHVTVLAVRLRPRREQRHEPVRRHTA